MKNKLCIIALGFLFSGACSAVSPAHALATAKPAPFMQRMPELVRDGGYVGSYLLLYSISQTITNPIKSYFRKSRTEQDAKQSDTKQTEKNTYIERAFDFTTNFITDAAIDWCALPLFYQQKKNPFHYYLVLSLAKNMLALATSPIIDFCHSKITNATRRRLLLSLGLSIPTIAGIDQFGERMACGATRSITGIKENPVFSFKLCLCGALLRFIGFSLYHPYVFFSLDKQLDELGDLASDLAFAESVTVQAWKVLTDKVDGVMSCLNDEEYAPKGLASRNLLFPTIDYCEEQWERACGILRTINRKISNLSAEENSPAAQELGAKLQVFFDEKNLKNMRLRFCKEHKHTASVII